MLTTLLRAARVSELRKKLAITAVLLLLFRVGSQLPAPSVSYRAVRQCVAGTDRQGILALIDLFSGGALLQLSVFALGVMPYITAAIAVQMLTPLVPKWAALKKDGAGGSAKLTQYTRYGTLAFAGVQAVAVAAAAQGAPSSLFPECPIPVVAAGGWVHAAVLGATFLVGAMVVMWMGENITKSGIGSGPSLIIMASIAAQLPGQFRLLVSNQGAPMIALVAFGMVALVAIIVFVEQALRKIPVIYPHKITSVAGSGNLGTHLPMKVNHANVIPVILAASMLQAPTIIAKAGDPDSGFARFVTHYLASGAHPVYMAMYTVLTVAFTLFYMALTYDSATIADDLRTAGGYVSGVNPGADTERYIDRVQWHLTAAGTFYIAIIALIPLLLLAASGGAASMPLGGTSLLILAGVALQTSKQLDAKLHQHQYPDLLPISPGGSRERPRSEQHL